MRFCFVLCLVRFRQFLKSGGEHIEEGKAQRTTSVKNAISKLEARYLEEAAKSAGHWTTAFFNDYEEHHIGELDPENKKKNTGIVNDFAATRGPWGKCFCFCLVVLGRSGRSPSELL